MGLTPRIAIEHAPAGSLTAAKDDIFVMFLLCQLSGFPHARRAAIMGMGRNLRRRCALALSPGQDQAIMR
jgi:hypothetical protein